MTPIPRSSAVVQELLIIIKFDTMLLACTMGRECRDHPESSYILNLFASLMYNLSR